VYGKNLAEIEKVAKQIEAVVKTVPGTTSAYAERLTGGYYLEIEPDRMALARYGLAVGDLLEVIATAMGGEMITTTVEGLERYSVSVRYPRELRSNPQTIATQVLVPIPPLNRGTGMRTADAQVAALNGMGSTMGEAMIPLGQLARVKAVKGPPNIRTENALLVAYIYVDIRDRDIGGYVADAQKAVREQVSFPPGYYAAWSGQFEYMERAKQKLKIVIPFTVLIIFLLLYLNFRRLTETLIVMLSVPFSLVGGIWLMYLLGYNMSVAVAVGFIALAGVAAEIGVIILIYMDSALRAIRERRDAAGERLSAGDLFEAVIQGALLRVRPIMMTVFAIIAGLLPIMWSTGTGSEVMRRIAAPMVGGMVSATILTLMVIPAIYAVVKGWSLERGETIAASRVVQPD
jgi:Cu(I)/Ag(I) efflux system membrane protein CusA/SilA